ncbi:uracil-DNA glycosylase [Patescibacteria group bacterium]|nr:uracil-DNA glycosylase [Patescibacteria group bacterium]
MELSQKSLEEVHEIISECKRCTLSEGRTKTVPGSGDAKAAILFIGEGPGKNEDLQGLPFVGAAGQFLTELLGTIGLSREDVFIANVVKCRPPGNRDPLPEEVNACFPYLERQVQLIDPLLIVTLGRHSMNRFIPGKQISAAHGKAFRREIEGLGKRVFFPIYHPAAALYRPQLKDEIIADFVKVPALLNKIEAEQDKEQTTVEIEQKAMF